MKIKGNLKQILLVAGLVLATIAALFWQNHQKGRTCTKQLFAMGTYMSFTAYGTQAEQAVDAAIEEIKRLDGMLSASSGFSEIANVNACGRGEISEETAEILKTALELHETTGGLFDITIYPLMDLWGFTSKEYHVPTEAEIAEVLRYVDASGVKLENTHVQLANGQKIDLGGIAKGYAAAKIMQIFESYGISSGMVSLGGNTQVRNTRPDGTSWNIGIRDPKGKGTDIVGSVLVENQAVVTSGGYERYFEEDGNTYIHILNPKTGYPADEGLISVTIVSEDGMLADALSTSMYLMGKEQATEYWKKHSDAFDMILITEDEKIWITEGIEKPFLCTGDYEVLKKEF